eukprot:6817456-Prymnesium_polylepis.1
MASLSRAPSRERPMASPPTPPRHRQNGSEGAHATSAWYLLLVRVLVLVLVLVLLKLLSLESCGCGGAHCGRSTTRSPRCRTYAEESAAQPSPPPAGLPGPRTTPTCST